MRTLAIIAIIVAVLYVLYLNDKGKAGPPKVKYVRTLPYPRQAMTVPPFGVFILDKYRGSETIYTHELCHWDQYRARGLRRFYRDYFGHTLKDGYSGNTMEKECYQKENEAESNNT